MNTTHDRDDEIERVAGPHLSAEEVEAFVNGETGVDRSRIELHRIWCPRCASRLDRVNRLLDGPIPAEISGRQSTVSPALWWQIAGAAVATLAAVVIAVMFLNRPKAEPIDHQARHVEPPAIVTVPPIGDATGLPPSAAIASSAAPAPAPAPAAAPSPASTTAPTTASELAPAPVPVALPAADAPRLRRVAIQEFTFGTSQVAQAQAGNRNGVGEGMRSLVATRAAESGKVAVLAHATPADGADILLVGEIVAFGKDDGRGGSPAFDRTTEKAVVVISYRLVDASTGEVLHSGLVQGESRRRVAGIVGFAAGRHGASNAPVDMTDPNFAETILGKATIEACDKLIADLNDQASTLK